jgi:hypothetical protein
MTDKPAPDDPNRRREDEGSDEGSDTEGHSLSLLMGLGALDRAREQERSRQRQKPDDELPPLSKSFPKMKDEPRK